MFEKIGIGLVCLLLGCAVGYFAIPHPKDTITVIDTLAVQGRDIVIAGLRGTIRDLAETSNRQTLENEKLKYSLTEKNKAILFYQKRLQDILNAPTDSSGHYIIPTETTSTDTSYSDDKVSFDAHLTYVFPPVDEFSLSLKNMTVKVPVTHEVQYRDREVDRPLPFVKGAYVGFQAITPFRSFGSFPSKNLSTGLTFQTHDFSFDASALYALRDKEIGLSLDGKWYLWAL